MTILCRLGLEAVHVLHRDTVRRHVQKNPKPMWLYTHPSKRPLQQYMLLSPIPAFYILQCVIYGAVSMSKEAKASSQQPWRKPTDAY